MEKDMDTGAADFDCRYRGSVYYDGHDVSGLFAHLHVGCMGGWNRVSFSAISSVCGSACMLESASGTKKQFSRLCAAPCAYEEIPLGQVDGLCNQRILHHHNSVHSLGSYGLTH